MIYALNTQDVSEHERRLLARLIRDDEKHSLNADEKVINVLDIAVGEGTYYCIYCMKRVHKWYRRKTVLLIHNIDKGCIGSDKGLPGIVNPKNITTKYP